jgi:hypothetical protein
MLFQYVRNKNHQRIGVLVAMKVEDIDDKTHVVVGWSKCNRKDRFNSDSGKELAIRRIGTGRTTVAIPRGVREHLAKFTDRAKRYFKIDQITITGR